MSDETKKPEQPVKKKFSTTKKVEFFSVDDQEFVVEQMSGQAMEEYRESMQLRFEMNPDSPTKSYMTKIKGTYQELFSRCVFKVLPGSNRTPLTGQESASWTDDCCQQVFALCQQINGLNDAGTDAAKND